MKSPVMKIPPATVLQHEPTISTHHRSCRIMKEACIEQQAGEHAGEECMHAADVTSLHRMLSSSSLLKLCEPFLRDGAQAMGLLKITC